MPERAGDASALDIEAILAATDLPTGSVTLCLKGSLVAEYERLDEALRDASPTPTSLADVAPGQQIAAQMAALRERMLAHERAFHFVAMPARKGSDFRTSAPQRKEGQPEAELDDAYHAWTCELVARCCTDPAMTAEQVDALSQRLSAAQWLRLANTAWNVNYNKRDVPFSVAAFALTPASGAKSKRPEQSEPAGHGSLAGPPSSEPSTPTTPTDA